MSAAGLKKLVIEHLRGSVQPFALSFEKGKKLTIVYGENATGKTTICDSLDFLGNGNVGSLDDRGLGKTSRYWHSLGKTSADVSVTLEDQGGSCTGTIKKTEVVCAPPECRLRVEVLRRSQILSLLQATAADRYKEIRSFIDVSPIETCENALGQLIRELTQNRQVALARVEENRAAIQQFWESEGKTVPDPISWAEEESKRNALTYNSEIAELTKLQSVYARLSDYPARLDAAQEALKKAKEAVSQTSASFEEAAKSLIKDAASTMALLEAAQEYLRSNPNPAACPLCDSAEKVLGLAESIASRLKAFKALQSARRKKDDATVEAQRAEQQAAILAANAKSHCDDFSTLAKAKWPEDVKLPSSPIPEITAELRPWLEGTSDLPAEWKKAEARRNDKRQFLDTLKRALSTWKQNVQAQRELDQLLPKLERALEIVKGERHEFTDKILSKIAKEVGRIYETVHPGEGLNKITLELDAARRASLAINASFCGTTTPPQAYFSDSHLDTLGLCVFLALATLDKPEQTILVLDDVLASIDEPHVERTIEMLYTEATKFRHCLITSHYRPWKQRLQWGWLKNSQIQFVELGEWSNSQGLCLIQAIPNVERLRKFLAESPPDVQSICAKAGYILEAALNFLTLKYECPCPRKAEDRYTVRDYMQAISKKLRDVLRVEVVKVDGKENAIVVERDVKLGPILNEIERIAEARNAFGCHFKELSFDLLDRDGIAFGQQVLALMDAVTDPEAGWPSKQQTDHWTTGDRTRRMYPLRRP